MTRLPVNSPAWLIIGYGNPMRRDDGLGWHAAQELAARLHDFEVEIIQCHQLTPELAEKISRAQSVVFIDAVTNGSPGEWTCDEIRPELEHAVFSHNPSPEGLLQLSRSLFGSVPRAWLFTICGNSFEFGEDLSPSASRHLPELVSEIVEMVAAQSCSARSSS